jgi:hypothetical protein
MNKPRKLRWTENVARTGETINAYILVGKLQGKTPRGRPRYRREDNIKLDRRKIGCEVSNWFHLTQIGFSSGFL